MRIPIYAVALAVVCPFSAAAEPQVATPETLAEVAKTASEIVLKPGVYDLKKIFPEPQKCAGKMVRIGRVKSLRGEDPDPAKTVLLGEGDGTNSSVHAFGAGGAATLENLTFRGFRTTDDGAALVMGPNTTRYHVKNCVFDGCASEGNGGAIDFGPNQLIEGCRFTNCRANGDGGAVRLRGSYVKFSAISNCTFVGNRSVGGAGGGLFVSADSRGKCPVVGCTFDSNVAAFRAPAKKRDLQFAWKAFPHSAAVIDEGNVYKGGEARPAVGGGELTKVTVCPGDDLIAVRDRLRRERKAGRRAEVVFEDGVYRLDRGIRLDERDADVTWRARHPGKVTVVGGWHFRGRDMARCGTNTVSIAVPDDVREAFAKGRINGGDNGQMGVLCNYNGDEAIERYKTVFPTYPVFSVDLAYMPLAGWPNGETFGCNNAHKEVIRPGTKTQTAIYRVPEGRSSRWDFAHADIHAVGFLSSCGFATQRASVTAGAETGTVEIAHAGFNGWLRFRFVNIMEEIDAPGEWCYDRAAGRIVLCPPEGFGPDSLCAVGTLADPFFFVRGSGVILEGFNFTAKHSHPAVVVEGGEHVSVRGCRFSALEYRAAFMSGRDNEFRSCDFIDLPADGLYVCGGDERTLEPGRNLVENCRASHFGFMRNGCAAGGFVLTGCGNRLRHCQADDSIETGITFSGVANLVEYCRTFAVSKWWVDAGAVYMPGGIPRNCGCVFRYNDIAAVPHKSVNALYLDDTSSGTSVYGNLIRDFGWGGIFVGCGRDNRCFNNLIVSPSGFGMGFQLDGRGLNWPGFVNPAARTNVVNELREKWPGETSPVARLFPFVRKWQLDVDTVFAPHDTVFTNNVVVDCRVAGGVGAGGEKFTPEMHIVSDGNLYVRTGAAARKGDVWSLGGFKTLYGATNQVLDVGLVDRPSPTVTSDGRAFTWRKGDFTLKKDSIIFKELPTFQPIPFDKIGLYKDDWRKDIVSWKVIR